jgi:hypothetical protein
MEIIEVLIALVGIAAFGIVKPCPDFIAVSHA